MLCNKIPWSSQILYILCFNHTIYLSFLFETAALQALKRKKRYEKQLAQIDGTLSTIEFQREALENAHTNTEVIKNMGYAAKAMKTAHDNMWGVSSFLSAFSSLFVPISLSVSRF